jgi:hypothetical protein
VVAAGWAVESQGEAVHPVLRPKEEWLGLGFARGVMTSARVGRAEKSAFQTPCNRRRQMNLRIICLWCKESSLLTNDFLPENLQAIRFIPSFYIFSVHAEIAVC